jgi:hypothetical protein
VTSHVEKVGGRICDVLVAIGTAGKLHPGSADFGGATLQTGVRRGDVAGGWTLAAIFLPNAIGFILYFLLRKPMPQRCPRSGEVISAEYNHCPHCGQALHPACPHCGRMIHAGDSSMTRKTSLNAVEGAAIDDVRNGSLNFAAYTTTCAPPSSARA